MMVRGCIGFSVALVLAFAFVGSSAKAREEAFNKTASGLEYQDTKVGTGAKPTAGQTCEVPLHRLALSEPQEG